MRISLFSFFTIVFFISCKKEQVVKLSFVDEYVLKDSIQFKGTTIGGLSGIDYKNGEYFMVIDDDDLPRIVSANIKINRDTISNIEFTDVIQFKDSVGFLKGKALDLESIFVDENNHFNIVSEGAIKNGKNPSIFTLTKDGGFIGSYELPEYFNANSYAHPRHNAIFEASCRGADENGFWVGMEGVLGVDGEAASQVKEMPPVRITHFSSVTKEATMQFAYPIDYIARPSKGRFNVNGVTAMLEYEKNKFFIVERSFQSGYGNRGNIVKVYKIELNKKVTNIFNIKSLKEHSYVPVEKELLFDFDTVREELTNGIIDNVEGITLGPILSNGNPSLILITDDNFQKHGKQLNQFILLEISK